MTLRQAEQWARRVIGLTALAGTALVLQGVVRAQRQPAGRTVGWSPPFARGSFGQLAAASILGAGVMYVLARPLPLRLSRRARWVSLVSGVALYFTGLGLMLGGRFALGKMYNVSTSTGAQLFAGHRLVTHGPFAYVRHPMYLGGQLAEIGALLVFRNWTTLLIATNVLTLPLRARREEEALAAEFGEEWEDYKRRVPAWLPRLRP